MIPTHLPNRENGITGFRTLPTPLPSDFERICGQPLPGSSTCWYLSRGMGIYSGFTPSLTHVRCVDYAVKIRVNPDQKGIDLNVKHSMVSGIHIHACSISHFSTESF